MREILFRGKRLDNEEWENGYLVCDTEFYGKPAFHFYIVDNKHPSGCFGQDIYKEVDPSTVGQYTGLTDKNGVKIFEGDICEFTVFDCFDHDAQYSGVVVYSGSRFMLWKSAESEYYGADGGFDLDWVVQQDDEFEIVGNLHDNPELLEGVV